MKKIAIIDDIVNIKYLKKNNVIIYKVRNNRIQYYKGEIFGYTHSTRIVEVLEKYCNEEITIINIALETKEKKFNIMDLKLALKFCIDLNVDVINLSIGSKKISDLRYINDEIEQLKNQKSKIVAAISNDFYMTIPGSLPQVIGVVHDFNGMLRPKEIARVKENFLGINYITNINQIFATKKFIPSNSFAVPYVISKLMKQDFEKKYRDSIKETGINKIVNNRMQEKNIPKVILTGICNPILIIQKLIINKRIESIGLQITERNIVLFSVTKILNIEGEILDIIKSVEQSIVLDLIVIFIKDKKKYRIFNADLYIEVDNNNIIAKNRENKILEINYENNNIEDIIEDYFESN